jgi:hypothetical protein
MTITRMLALRQRLHGLANPVPLGPRARISPPSPRLLACGWCYEENGEEVHPHPECPIGRPVDDVRVELLDARLALSEANGRITRTTARLQLVVAELEARHVRYAWTEGLAAELRNIAHDTTAPR